MLTFEGLKSSGASRQVKNARGEGWVCALPMPGPFIVRFREAWEVLQGRAHAIRETTAEEAEAQETSTRLRAGMHDGHLGVHAIQRIELRQV